MKQSTSIAGHRLGHMTAVARHSIDTHSVQARQRIRARGEQQPLPVAAQRESLKRKTDSWPGRP